MSQGERGVRESLEANAGVLLGVACAAMAAWWFAALFYKWFSRTPILYATSPSLGAETIPVLFVTMVFVACLIYNTIVRLLTRGAFLGSYLLELVAPWALGISVLVLFLWIYSGPNKEASYLPLLCLVFASALGTYAPRWGHLQYRAPRDRVRANAEQPAEDAQAGPVRVSKPSTTFASIHGNEAIKQRLLGAAVNVTAKRADGAKPRNGILLHGLPGNGKNLFAEALAGELKLPFLQLAYADVASQWVGEKSAKIRVAFEQARREQPCVLFIDEIDSFLESRDGRNDGTKEDRDLVNAMLTLLTEIRQQRVIVVAATNHLDKLDSAGIREGRFDFKVEITPPDEPARVGLLKKGLRDNAPNVRVADSVVDGVAKRWNGFSSKRILAVTEELPTFLGDRKEAAFDDFMGALRQLQGQRGHVAEQGKSLNELLLEPGTREMIDLIVARMGDPEHTEKHGGTLPTGILFSGPPGTGKTATCKAMAKELGWAFLPSTGADLARDPKKLEALYAKAQDLRPAIIFVDEADELLRSREFSPTSEATNKLLTLMDGVGDRVRDVVWVAATNSPEQIDSAMLRGGRFTEKVKFVTPSTGAMATFVESWLSRRSVVLAVSGSAIAEALAGQSIANAEAVLQAMVNRAVSRREDPVAVVESDVRHGLEAVLGGI